jgi:Uma2 family endonuclease
MSEILKPIRKSKALYTADNLPESDGKPMGETHKHVMLILDTLNALQNHFRDDPKMYVIGNVFVYFLDKLAKLNRVAPDIFAVRGVSKEERRVYALEKEGKAPELVIEFTSKRTRKTDLVKKRNIYAWLGVKEYFIFDPYGEHLEPRLMGLKLQKGKYVEMSSDQTRFFSAVLGLEVTIEGENLRFYDPRSGTRLMTHLESEVARQAAEEEVLRLREEMEKMRKAKR